MKKRGLLGLGAIVLCLLCSAASAQYHVPRGAGRKQWAQPPDQHRPAQATQSSNPLELRTEADELAKLAQSVPSDIDAVTNRGLVPKNLMDKLERIQKLSKKLRSQIQP